MIPDRVIEKIQSFSDLEIGWDYGKGIAPDLLVIEYAIYLYNKFKKIGFNVDVTPITQGGITLIFYMGDNFIDIRIKGNQQIDLRKEVGIGVDYEVINEEEHVTIDRIEEMLNETYSQCNLLEPYTSRNTFQVSEDSKVTASVITETASLFLTEDADCTNQVQSAHIL